MCAAPFALKDSPFCMKQHQQPSSTTGFSRKWVSTLFLSIDDIEVLFQYVSSGKSLYFP